MIERLGRIITNWFTDTFIDTSFPIFLFIPSLVLSTKNKTNYICKGDEAIIM